MRTLVGCFMGMALAASQVAAQRTTLSLDGIWRFTKDDSKQLQAQAFDFNDCRWQEVRVPHDWAISGPFNPDAHGGSGKLPWQGVGWYRRSVVVPATFAGNSVYLDFDGVMASPEVYVNGKKAGGWDYGYMSFRVDATPFFRFGKENVIAVRADTTAHHSRWYPGAGIYRSVRMVLCPQVQIAHQATFLTTREITGEGAWVHLNSAVINRTEKESRVDVRIALRDPDGNAVATETFRAVAIPAHGRALLSKDFLVCAPKLWDVESPNLYTAEIALSNSDSETTRFGIRTIAFPPDDGFHLNGRRVQLHGVCLHADLGPLGMAFNKSAMRRQLSIMKDMGVNALRTSHNAPAPGVLELCDEMGIVVWDECFDKWDGTAGRKPEQNLEEYVARNCRALAQRDRNHPCVIIWSIGNEITPDGFDWNGKNPKATNGMNAKRFREFRAAIREFDTSRPVGIGCCHANAVDTGMFAELDISGWNYRRMYTRVKDKHPGKPVVYSESASALSSYGYFSNPPEPAKTVYAYDAHEVDGYDHNAADWSDIPDLEFDRMEKDKYCCGEFVWTGIDYIGEPTPVTKGKVFGKFDQMPEKELARSSYFGIADLMVIPKDRYYLYRSYWNKKDETIHILPHWNWQGKEGKNVPVYVYTSGDSAELFLNGKSLGRRTKGEKDTIINLAKGKNATASSVEVKPDRQHPAQLATDGNTDTRWCASTEAKSQWWQVDLGKETPIRTVCLTFERGPQDYACRIQIGNDGKNWKDAAAKKLGEATSIFTMRETGRYLRVVFDDLKPGSWASLRDVTVCDQEVDAYRLNPYYDVCAKYRLRWFNVPYQPGELKVVAYKAGKKIGEQVMRTAGKPVAIQLTPEKTAVPADGDSVVFVQVDVVDANGIRDPRATNRIAFELTGPGEIVAVGNANPRGFDTFTDTRSHPLYYGKAVAVIRREKGRTEPITLKATTDGMKAATITLQ